MTLAMQGALALKGQFRTGTLADGLRTTSSHLLSDFIRVATFAEAQVVKTGATA